MLARFVATSQGPFLLPLAFHFQRRRKLDGEAGTVFVLIEKWAMPEVLGLHDFSVGRQMLLKKFVLIHLQCIGLAPDK